MKQAHYRPSPALFPFESRYFQTASGARMHYIDEGQGDPVVFVHGNPTWSFYYRGLVQALRAEHRCIAMDHVGMGLSDRPTASEYSFTLKERVDDLDNLLDSLGVSENVTLVVHDWGGMIGFAWAARHSERIARLVVLNTAAFPLPSSRSFHLPLRFVRTGLGAQLVRRFNAFAEVAARKCVTRHKLSDEVREHYVEPYSAHADNLATLRFVEGIPLAEGDEGYDIVDTTARALDGFRKTPTLICWGARDFVFDEHFLDEWKRRMPHADVRRFADCGHYILEDAADEVRQAVESFVASEIPNTVTSSASGRRASS